MANERTDADALDLDVPSLSDIGEPPKPKEGVWHKILRLTNPVASYGAKTLGKAMGVTFPEPPMSWADLALAQLPAAAPPGEKVLAGLVGMGADVATDPLQWVSLGAGEIPETVAVARDLSHILGPTEKEALKLGEGFPAATVGDVVRERIKPAILRVKTDKLKEVSDLAARKRLADAHFDLLDPLNPREVDHDKYLEKMFSYKPEDVESLSRDIFNKLNEEKSVLRFKVPFVGMKPKRIPGLQGPQALMERIGDFFRGRKPYSPEMGSLLGDLLQSAQRPSTLDAIHAPTLQEIADSRRLHRVISSELEQTPDLERLVRGAYFRHKVAPVGAEGIQQGGIGMREAAGGAKREFESLLRQQKEGSEEVNTFRDLVNLKDKNPGLVANQIDKTIDALKNAKLAVVGPYNFAHLFELGRLARMYEMIPKEKFSEIASLVSEHLKPETMKALDETLGKIPIARDLVELGGKPISSWNFEFFKDAPAIIDKFGEIDEKAIANKLIRGIDLNPTEREFIQGTTDLVMNSEDPAIIRQFVERVKSQFPNFEIILGHALESPRVTARVYAPYSEIVKGFPKVADGIPAINRWFGGLLSREFPGVEIHPETIKIRELLASSRKKLGERPVRASQHPEVIQSILDAKSDRINEPAIHSFMKTFVPGVYDEPRAQIENALEDGQEAVSLQAKTDPVVLPGFKYPAEIQAIISPGLPRDPEMLGRYSPEDWRSGHWIQNFLFEETGLISNVLKRIGLQNTAVGKGWESAKGAFSPQMKWLYGKARTAFSNAFGLPKDAIQAQWQYEADLNTAFMQTQDMLDMLGHEWGSLRKDGVDIGKFMESVFLARAYDHPDSLALRDEALLSLEGMLKNPEDAKRILGDLQALHDQAFSLYGPDAYKVNYTEWQIVGKDRNAFLSRYSKEDLPTVGVDKFVGGSPFMEKRKHFRNFAEYEKFWGPELQDYLKENPKAQVGMLRRADRAIAYYFHEAKRFQAARRFMESLPKVLPGQFAHYTQIENMKRAVASGLANAAVDETAKDRLRRWGVLLDQYKYFPDLTKQLEAHVLFKKLDGYMVNPDMVPWLRNVIATMTRDISDDYASHLINALSGLMNSYKILVVLNPNHALRIADDYTISEAGQRWLWSNIGRFRAALKEKSANALYREAIAANLFQHGQHEWREPFYRTVLEEGTERKGLFDTVVSPINRLVWDADKTMRLSVYSFYREQRGFTPFMAAEATNHFLVDYALRYMPPKTKRMARLIFPFYAWWSGNLALHATEFVKQPEKYLARLRFIEALNTGNAGHDMEQNPQGFLERTDLGISPVTGTHIYVNVPGLMPSLMAKSLADLVYMNGMLGVWFWLRSRMWPPFQAVFTAGQGGYGQSPDKMRQDLSQRATEYAQGMAKDSMYGMLQALWAPRQIVTIPAQAARAAVHGKLWEYLNPLGGTEPFSSALGMEPRYYPRPKMDSGVNAKVFQAWDQQVGRWLFGEPWPEEPTPEIRF